DSRRPTMLPFPALKGLNSSSLGQCPRTTGNQHHFYDFLCPERAQYPMPQSLAALHVHLIFSTKNREPFLTPEIEGELFPYMATIFLELHSPATIINGAADHVHCLFSLARPAAVSDVVEQFKRSSSIWI